MVQVQSIIYRGHIKVSNVKIRKYLPGLLGQILRNFWVVVCELNLFELFWPESQVTMFMTPL